MNIGIDARLLCNGTGIGRYTRSLFFALARRQSQTDTYFLLFDRDYPPGQIPALPSNFRALTAHCQTRMLWTNWHVPRLLRQHGIEVYHGVCNFELPVRKACRYVVTIHDLVPLFFPKLVPKKHRLFFELFMKRAAHTADLIITDSEHSKQDIVRYLNVPAEKIRVIYLGYEPSVPHGDDPPRLAAILKRYGISQPYLLFVGVIEPKKNLARLLEAFALLRQETSVGKELQLVLAGGKGWFSDHLLPKVQELRLTEQVIFTGFVPEADLPDLYRGAEVFVFPSIYEGFGLPVVEAMAHGVPVVTSNGSSLPEIAGDAGILVDPHDPAAICAGIAEVLRHPGKKDRMRRAGLQRAQQFTWQQTAAATYQVYQEVYRQ